MMRVLLILLMLVLAGCAKPSDPAAEPTDGQTPSDPEPESVPTDPVEVQSTKTTGVIRGVVVDESVRPIAGAMIRLQGTDKAVQSNTAGEFGFSDLEPGIHFMNVTHPRYLPSQTSARVEAGVDNPDMLQVQLVYDETKEPRFEQAFVTMQVPGDFCVAGDCRRLASGSNSTLGVQTWAMVTTTGMPQAIQVEVHWEATNALGVWGTLSCFAIGATGSDRFGPVTGVESIVLRVRGVIEGDDGPEGIDRLSCDFAADGDANPVVAMVNQEIDTIITTFYNFEEDANWTAADGEPKAPMAR